MKAIHLNNLINLLNQSLNKAEELDHNANVLQAARQQVVVLQRK